MKKINTLNSVIQTTEGRKNLGITQSMLPRSFAPLWMTVMMVLAFTACSEEDLVQPTNGEAGSLHISSVIIDGQEVGRSRMAYEGSVTHDYHYNRSITGFTDGDKLTLSVGFTGTNRTTTDSKAVYGNGTWSIEKQHKPDPTKNNENWEGGYIVASISSSSVGGKYETNGKYQQVAQTMGIVQGDIPEYEYKENVKEYHYSYIVGDWLAAKSNPTSHDDDKGYGSITIDTDLNSPTLGATTIVLKHCDRALLRLPMTTEALKVTRGDYIVNGERINLTSLASLWAVFRINLSSGEANYEYSPFTKVKIGGQDYLQAIVSCSYSSFVGFKAVMCTNESGKVGSEGFDESKTHTLDLPFKVGGAASNNYKFASNTQYPMKLNISPNSAAVTFTTPNGKPGWNVSEDEEQELSNADNEFDLKYIAGEGGAAGTFMVKTAQGLQDLNLWMVGTKPTADFKALGYAGCGDIADDISNANRYAQNITLAADITLPTVGDGESNWTPIGNSSNIYSGVFDGNNKTIKNLTIVDGSSFYLGLIGTLSGTVQNLKLKNAKIDGSTFRSLNFSRVGGIVGAMQDGANVLGCTVSGNIWGGNSYVGGIVGTAGTGFLIENCITAVGSEVKGFKYVGGILGESAINTSNRSRVTGCINKGTVVRPEDNSSNGGLGGIVANGKALEITNCTNEGTLTSYDDCVYQGGILGKGITCKLENCTNIATATLTVGSISNNQFTYLGGIMGYADGTIDVKGCINHANIAFTYNATSNYVGGIVGYVKNDVSGTGFVACGNIGTITINAMEGVTSSNLYVGGIAGHGGSSCKYSGCWTKDVVEHYCSMTAVQTQKDGFGYVYSASSIINSYTASAKTEGTDQAFINGKTGYTDDETSGEGMSMNKALETLFYASGKPGASLSTKYYWKANTNGGWPTLTTTAPTMPTGN